MVEIVHKCTMCQIRPCFHPGQTTSDQSSEDPPQTPIFRAIQSPPLSSHLCVLPPSKYTNRLDIGAMLSSVADGHGIKINPSPWAAQPRL